MDFQVANWFYNTFGNNKVILTIAKIITHIGDFWSIVAILAVLLAIKKTRKLRKRNSRDRTINSSVRN